MSSCGTHGSLGNPGTPHPEALFPHCPFCPLGTLLKSLSSLKVQLRIHVRNLPTPSSSCQVGFGTLIIAFLKFVLIICLNNYLPSQTLNSLRAGPVSPVPGQDLTWDSWTQYWSVEESEWQTACFKTVPGAPLKVPETLSCDWKPCHRKPPVLPLHEADYKHVAWGDVLE